MIVLSEIAVTPSVSYAIAVDPYNLVIARRFAGNYSGYKFYPKFAFMEKTLKQLGIDVDNVRALIQQALFHVHKLPQSPAKVMTLAELDKRFQPFKSKQTVRSKADTSGVTQFYTELRSFVKGAVSDEEEEDEEASGKSNATIDVPVFEGRATPQTTIQADVDESDEEEAGEAVDRSVPKAVRPNCPECQGPPGKARGWRHVEGCSLSSKVKAAKPAGPKFGSLLSAMRAAARSSGEEDIVMPKKKVGK